jgi:hypothetical protein
VLNPAESDPLLRFEFDRRSNYEQDSRLTFALAALIPDDELINPDHRLFQVVHLITEYAWAAMHHEIRRAVAGIDQDDHFLAVEALDRAAGLGAIPVQAVRLLVRHLPQFNLLAMREIFPPNTTGLDSPGARNLRRASVALWRSFESALGRHGVTLADTTSAVAAGRSDDQPRPDARGLAAVRGGLHRLDLIIQEWKQVHLKLVWTELGGHPDAGRLAGTSANADRALPTSLRGRPVSDVERMASRALFPPLWQEADVTYQAMTTPADQEGLSP